MGTYLRITPSELNGLMPYKSPQNNLYKKYGAKIYLFCTILSTNLSTSSNNSVWWLDRMTQLK